MYTYFIKGNTTGLVKIGRSSDVKRRLRDMQAFSPDELVLLGATLDRDHTAEQFLHKKFSHLRVRGEWFQGTEELHSFIEKTMAEPRNFRVAERGKLFKTVNLPPSKFFSKALKIRL